MQLSCFHDIIGSFFFNLADINFVIIYFILIDLPFCSAKNICLLSLMYWPLLKGLGMKLGKQNPASLELDYGQIKQ